MKKFCRGGGGLSQKGPSKDNKGTKVPHNEKKERKAPPPPVPGPHGKASSLVTLAPPPVRAPMIVPVG